MKLYCMYFSETCFSHSALFLGFIHMVLHFHCCIPLHARISPFCDWTFRLYLVFLPPKTVQLCAFMFFSPGVKLYSKRSSFGIFSSICCGLMLFYNTLKRTQQCQVAIKISKHLLLISVFILLWTTL